MAPLLETRALRSAYGRIEVLHGIDLHVTEGEIVALVGANGAGKTTLMRCLSGVQPVTGGEVVFRGQSLSRVPGHRRAGLGLSQSPEGRQIFGELSVDDNLRLGAWSTDRRRMSQGMEEAFALFPMLREKRALPAGSLSGGQQQMLAIARALMAEPVCLLLDEPTMGLAPALIDEIFDVITRLRDRGMTVLLVEQNAFGALSIADRAYVLESGHVTLAGPAADLIQDDRMRAAYLGL
ncbi:ABC transporter ATP-binding protein [Pararhodospirillum photometricum]|uniref:ABC-type branched-chain amino acid transport systems n=1 Tax=Pararhodospirillum photometricum DSM 122 TaxID=1150469 RepID=H6SKH9_PARPM|nr:ABC transporter ATP-binding protein [Pararhodospirillum photometricum]CCG08494.1 ABC-type branched-chain amino acid transport systems [Pararhodospirillum photometricum DSM 122]